MRVKKQKSCAVFMGLIFCGLLIGAPQKSEAVLSVSVNPVDGGNTLRFGQIDLPDSVAKEVDIRITSTEATQYQIFQRFVGPLVNEQGEFLDQSSILVSALNNSNMLGTLYLQSTEPLEFSEQIIYTSSPNGEGDFFTLFYQVDPQQMTKSGNFVGEILYTVRPIGGARQDEVILNVYLEAGDDFSFDYMSSSGKDLVALNVETDEQKKGFFEISYEGNRGREFRIYQEVLQFPANELNETMNSEILTYHVTGSDQADVFVSDGATFERGKKLIYSSYEPKDALAVHFQLDDTQFAQQKAGSFFGRIRFTLESDQYRQSIDLDLSVDIASLFEVVIELPEEGMSFSNLLPGMDAQHKEIIVNVKTNLGKPYTVNQKAKSLMANEEGDLFQEDKFTMIQELFEGEKGEVLFPEFTQVPEEDTAVFVSDKIGSAARFKVLYKLEPYSTMEPGEYRTSMVYSLGEI